MVARLVRDQEAAGSNPVAPTIDFIRGLMKLGRGYSGDLTPMVFEQLKVEEIVKARMSSPGFFAVWI